MRDVGGHVDRAVAPAELGDVLLLLLLELPAQRPLWQDGDERATPGRERVELLLDAVDRLVVDLRAVLRIARTSEPEVPAVQVEEDVDRVRGLARMWHCDDRTARGKAFRNALDRDPRDLRAGRVALCLVELAASAPADLALEACCDGAVAGAALERRELRGGLVGRRRPPPLRVRRGAPNVLVLTSHRSGAESTHRRRAR